jgi:hypothetical protein
MGKGSCPPSEGGEVRGLESQQDECGRVVGSVGGYHSPLPVGVLVSVF